MLRLIWLCCIFVWLNVEGICRSPKTHLCLYKVTKNTFWGGIVELQAQSVNTSPYFPIVNNSWLWKYNTQILIFGKKKRKKQLSSFWNALSKHAVVVVLCSPVLRSCLCKVFKHCNVIRALKLAPFLSDVSNAG